MIFGTPQIVTSGLVLHLDAGNRKSYVSGSTVWNDLSGLNNSGSLVNGPTFSSANQGSIVFDGVNDTVVLGSTFITGSGDFSLCSFVRRSVNNTFDYICGNYGSANNGVELYYFNNNTALLYIAGTVLAGITTVTDLGWHYICGVRVSGVMQVYIDGRIDNSRAVSPSLSVPGNNPFTIGNAFDFNSEAFGGNIATCQVYNRALSPQEIAQNYNALKSRFGLF